MRFASLGSGSRGNATLVEAGGTCLMVDCGFSVIEAERRFQQLGGSPGNLRAVLVTHEHGDHVRGVVRFARKHRLPIWMTAGTCRALGLEPGEALHLFDGHNPFVIGGLEIQPVPVPHDAKEPSQFVFSDGAHRLGLLTDTGNITAHIQAALSGCDGLILECNHAPDLLAAGPYPPSLKQRVAGRLGHLSNAQAAGLLRGIDTGRLQHIVASHLSEKNNTPRLARQALADALGCAPDWIAVADQLGGLAWRQLD